MKRLHEFHVGDTFQLSRTCDRYRPIYYAAASGDFNPIHIDPDVGRLAGQPGAILQGMCTMAWLADACLRYFDDPGRTTALSARFARPVNVGDTVRFEGRCVAVDGRRVRVEVTATNQRGEAVLKAAFAEAVVEEERP
ncbi:MAG TPA: MaoC/PaaZ C-terminal domain-containing protein [Anaeromyxobacteraceae bacterium]